MNITTERADVEAPVAQRATGGEAAPAGKRVHPRAKWMIAVADSGAVPGGGLWRKLVRAKAVLRGKEVSAETQTPPMPVRDMKSPRARLMARATGIK